MMYEVGGNTAINGFLGASFSLSNLYGSLPFSTRFKSAFLGRCHTTLREPLQIASCLRATAFTESMERSTFGTNKLIFSTSCVSPRDKVLISFACKWCTVCIFCLDLDSAAYIYWCHRGHAALAYQLVQCNWPHGDSSQGKAFNSFNFWIPDMSTFKALEALEGSWQNVH